MPDSNKNSIKGEEKMSIQENIEQTKIYKAIRKSKHFRKLRHSQLKSGRFTFLTRFTSFQNYLLESLYTMSDLRNPSAYRLYLYLVRQITGYKDISCIEFRKKKIKKQMNINNSLYNAIKALKDRNMIYFIDKNGIEYIGLNPYPDTWKTKSIDRINEIIDKEFNLILGITDDSLVSVSSSSWSSSSSSSTSYIMDEDLAHKELLKELDNM